MLDKVWKFIWEKGFFGLVIFKEDGGLGFFNIVYFEIVMKIFICSVLVVVIVMVFNFFGFGELLMYYGIDE